MVRQRRAQQSRPDGSLSERGAVSPKRYGAFILGGALSIALAACQSDGNGQNDSNPPGEAATVNPRPELPPPEPPPPDPVPLELDSLVCDTMQAVPSEGRLLTRSQYNNTVRDLFAGRLVADYAVDFPSENQVLGFSTNAEFHRASPLLAERHLTAAERISDDAMPYLAEVLPCSATTPDRACAETFVDDFGQRAFRRPLTSEERTLLLDLYDNTVERDGFLGSVRLLIQVLLQSPQFLYRFEFAGTALAAGTFELTGYELASRLSYLLWNTMPDEALFAAAAAGQLEDSEGVLVEARRMLLDLKARDAVADFYAQWLRLDRFKGIARDLDGVPTAFGDAWRSSLGFFVSHVFSNDGGDLNALFTSPTVFLNDQLAALYGVPVPEGTAPGQFFRAEMDPTQRAGLLTQPGLMALYAHPNQSAPIQRGVFVRDALLCQPAPAPPPDVNNTPPDPAPGLTTRERFAVHTEDDECALCHQLIDPIGLSFEGFDALGRYREQENGLAVDVSGEIVGVRETSIAKTFSGTVELAALLADSRQVSGCITTQWYRYGLGRVEQSEDLCSIKHARDLFLAADGNMTELLLGIVSSDAFRYRAVPNSEGTL